MLTQDQLDNRKFGGLFMGSAAVFIALMIVNYLDFIKKQQELQYLNWDAKTVTVGDYTVEFKLPEGFYNKWVEKWSEYWITHNKAKNGKPYLSLVEAFRDWLQSQMERRLDVMPDLGYEDEPVLNVKIAMTTFAFENGAVISLLTERGRVIQNEKWDQMDKMDQKINQLKDSAFEKICTPCAVFMTFENEEGVNRALNYDKAVEEDPRLAELKYWLDEYELDIQQAPEPTDIIWEAREITPRQRFKRRLIVDFVLFLILLGSFCVVFYCKWFSSRITMKFPDVECSSETTSEETMLIMERQAILEWKTNKKLEEKGKNVSYDGKL